MSQFFLLVLTILAIALIQCERRKLRFIGSIVGVAAQPFWFYETYTNDQWGMLVVTCLMTIIYLWGVLKHGTHI